MSNYPNSYDDDTTLPVVNDNIDQIGGDAINALRDAVMQIELSLGLDIAGSTPSLAARLGVFINPDGSPNSSIITSLGLVTLPIYDFQVATNAAIVESKLKLDYRTQDLFNYIRDLSRSVNIALDWIAVTGVKLEPHLIGAIYRHDLLQIDVAPSSAQFLNNVFRVARDNSDAYTVISDMNNELLAHQWADGSQFGTIKNIITNNGSSYPSNYGHIASGIYLETGRFAVIPQTATDVQSALDFLDSESILTLGTRVQNLYHNGISRNSTSSSLTADGYGQSLVPATPAIAYLRGLGNSSFPVDDIAIGEDIIQFMPSNDVLTNNTFDEQFALVRAGDIVRVNYGADGYNIEVPFVISEKKYIQSGGNKIFIVRIAGKNIAYSPNAVARIDKPLFNNNKHGVLAVSGVNSPTSVLPSLIIGSPRGAQCLGVNFSADQFNETHYFLYLALYTTGNPLDGYTILPGIDVTGNLGRTPGSYTLSSIVEATNQALRQPGFNYRFIAFEHEGEFGIMLADPIGNASFSIISAVVSGAGVYDQTNTQLHFPNNVIDVFPVTGSTAPDPLGLGPSGANVASPPFQTTYGSAEAALYPTIVLPPLSRNNYYVNGAERERLNLDVSQVQDTYGDGYWVATIDGYTNNPGPPGHTTVTYNIPLDLSASKLKAGKTIVVQPHGTNFGLANYGRFIIQSVNFSCCPPVQTQITVYDGVHGTGVSPYTIAPVGSQVGIYLSSSSLSFNAETVTDFSPISAVFKRHFEVYVDSDGNTFTHERGRISINATVSVNGINLYTSSPFLGQLDIVYISPKLRGYQFGSVNKITLQVTSFDPVSGTFTGNLASYDGVIFTRQGPTTTGKVGEVIRFYDETNTDYLEVILELGNTIPALTNEYIDFQLFPSLALDEEVMLLASCQEQSDTNTVTQIRDLRQFGNTSEEELTTSALDYIALPERLLHFNGIFRGFDTTTGGTYNNGALLNIKGGLALVDGNIVSINDQIFTIPPLQEVYSTNHPINFALCVNSDGDLVTIILTDYDDVLGTPNAPNRVVTVENLVSGNSYPVDSATFSYILNDRKDLTLLYIVSSTVTGSGSGAATTVTLRDVRRFANDSDSSIPAVLTSGDSQGNFKSLTAALAWLKFNSTYQKKLEVKGAFSMSTDPELNFPLDIVSGGSTASLIFNSAMTISNVTFTDLTVTFNAALTATNVTFTNCTVTFNGATSFTNVTFDPCTVGVNGIITATSSQSYDSTFNVSIAQGFTLGSELLFRDCTFNYNFDATGAIGYSSTDPINAGSGMMYNIFTGALNDIEITNCVFNSKYSNHFPFIALELGGPLGDGYGAIAQNIKIESNKFNSLVTTTEDRRAVVSIISTTIGNAVLSSGYPAFPKLVNVSVSNNICNYNQIILLSALRTPGSGFFGAMLACTDCKINGNVCGVIGYMTSADLTSKGNNAETANLGTIRDKTDGLVISNNTCKLISNLDSTGQYIVFTATETTNTKWVTTNTGPCGILDNVCNWILVGSCSYGQGLSYSRIGNNASGVRIQRNRLSPNDSSFLNTYVDTASGITPPAIGILLRQGTYFQGDFDVNYSIISDNILSNKYYLESVGVTTSAFTYVAGIKCENSANIYGNTIGHVIDSASAPMMLLGGTNTGGPVIKCHNNIFDRSGGTVSAYVAALNSNATNNVVITNNLFADPTIDGSSTATGLNIPAAWKFHSNTNQTGYMSVSLVDHAVYPLATINIPTNNTTTRGARPADAIYYDTTRAFVIGRYSPLVDLINQIAGISNTVVLDISSVPAPAGRQAGFTIPLDLHLPDGAQIITVTLGIYLELAGVATLDIGANTNNQFTIALQAFNPSATSNNPTYGVADVKASVFSGSSDASVVQTLNSSLYVTSSSGSGYVTIADLQANTQYLQINSAAISPYQTYFTVDGNHRIALSFDMNYLRSGGSTSNDQIHWFISPVLVQYRW